MPRLRSSSSLSSASISSVSDLFLTETLVTISLGLGGGGGGFLTLTVVVFSVWITPVAVYVPVASDARAVLPGRVTVPGGAALNLKVLVPE